MELLKQIFSRHWTKETSSSSLWNSNNLSTGQCVVSALAFQDIFGGCIKKVQINNIESHYFNTLNGHKYDLTADQYSFIPDYSNGLVVDRTQILKNADTNKRYEIFKTALMGDIRKKLPLEEIEHLTIRDPNYVAGSDKKPEVKVFCQTNKSRKPLNDKMLAPGQNVYMKWTGGPIVAVSKLVSWHSGTFDSGNINKLRELTIGTNLFGLTEYWKSVSNKGHGKYTVIHLSEEKWMQTLLFPNEKSYGSSWIYLDTLEKKLKWLSIEHEPIVEKESRRNIPAGMRFNVLRRDNFTCQYCGRSAPDVELHIDHVVPWSKVKEHKIDNLKVACSDCNLGKSDKMLT